MSRIKDIFQPDNAFNVFLTRVFDLLMIELLWVICSIPLVTIGAAWSAMYTITLRWARGEDTSVIKGFFEAFRSNLRQGFAASILFWIISVILVTDLHILGNNGNGSADLLYGACIVMCMMAIAFFSYLFPLIARFENTLKGTADNAWRLAVTHLPQTAAIVCINALPILWFMFSPGTFMAVLWLWLLLGGSVSAYCCSLLLSPVFEKITK